MTDFRDTYRDELWRAEAVLGRLTRLVLETETPNASLQKRVNLVARVAWDARSNVYLADVRSAFQLSEWLFDRTDDDRLCSRVYKSANRSYQVMVPSYLLEPGRGARHTAFIWHAVRVLGPAYRVRELW